MRTWDFVAKIKCPKCGYDGFDDEANFWSEYPVRSMYDSDAMTIKCSKCDNAIEIIANERIIVTYSNYNGKEKIK